MRFLADENFPRPTIRALRDSGFEVASAAEQSPGLADEHVLASCVAATATLLTLDKDFGELVFRQSLPAECGVILFRVNSDSPRRFTSLVLAALQSRDDWNGFFSVVTNDRIRMTPLNRPATDS